MTLLEKAGARRARLRARATTREEPGRITAPERPVVDPDVAYIRIGRIKIKTGKRPRLNTRGTDIDWKPGRKE